MKFLIVAVVLLAVAGFLVWKRAQEEPAAVPYVPTDGERERIRPLAVELQGVVSALVKEVTVGMTTKDLDRRAAQLLQEAGMVAAMDGYNGFPAATAVSLNEEVLHGIPSTARTIQDGDLVTLQVTAKKNGVHAAVGWTFGVGSLSAAKLKLLATAERALDRAVNEIAAGARLGNVGAVIQETVEGEGFSVVRDFVGYGMGRLMLTEPQVSCVGVRERGPRMKQGQVLNLHVIVAEKGWPVEILDDEWTAVTRDRSLSVLMTAMVEVQEEGRFRMIQSFGARLPEADRGQRRGGEGC